VRDRENDDEITTSGLKDSDKGSDKKTRSLINPFGRKQKNPRKTPMNSRGI
jgi:hypothetical protein